MAESGGEPAEAAVETKNPIVEVGTSMLNAFVLVFTPRELSSSGPSSAPAEALSSTCSVDAAAKETVSDTPNKVEMSELMPKSPTTSPLASPPPQRHSLGPARSNALEDGDDTNLDDDDAVRPTVAIAAPSEITHALQSPVRSLDLKVRRCFNAGCLWRLMCPRRCIRSGTPVAHDDVQSKEAAAVEPEAFAEPRVITAEPCGQGPLSLSFYQDPNSLFEQLRGKPPPVKLLKSSWLLERARRVQAASTDAERRRLALPRRQVLEREEPWAFYSAEEVEALPRGPEAAGSPLHLVSISHCWATPEHPDPLAKTLEMIAEEMALAQTRPVSRAIVSNDDGQTHLHMLPGEVAVFYDYCSLFQKDEDGMRTPQEDALFRQALRVMQVWYAHLGTTVFLMTELPACYAGHTLKYHQRGWTTFERLASMIGKRSTISAWPMIVDAGSGTGTSGRLPPLTVDSFRELLDGTVFTNGTDRHVVVDLYRQTCEAVLRGAPSLRYSSLDWGDDELRKVCSWLLECNLLTELALTCNPRIGDDGLIAFASAVSHPDALPNLQTFALEGSLNGVRPQFGDVGIRALTAALSQGALPRLTYIDVTGSRASRESMRELTTVCHGRNIFCCDYELDEYR